MTHISGHDRSQMLLLPEEVDDYVDADNPMRFVDAFVDELNLAAAGFKRVTRKVTREVTLPRPPIGASVTSSNQSIRHPSYVRRLSASPWQSLRNSPLTAGGSWQAMV
jgi:hypothetical protein